VRCVYVSRGGSSVCATGAAFFFVALVAYPLRSLRELAQTLKNRSFSKISDS